MTIKTSEIKPIKVVIFETGRPKDANDWSNYERREIEIKPTINAREAALRAEEKLKQKGIKK